MGIVNRTLDSTEQQHLENANVRLTATGESDVLFHAPHPMEIQSAKMVAVGLSGSPTAQLALNRFVVGAGDTLIPLGPAVALVAVGTSGPQAFSFSSTTIQSGDRVVVTNAGTNAGVDQLNVAIVVKALQDVKSWSF